MNISHNGLGELVTTFETNSPSPVSAGTLIKLVSGKAAAAGAADEIVGVAADDSRNCKVAVQVGGYIKANYTGTAECGRQYIIAAANNKVEFCDASTAKAIPVKVLFVDATNHIAGFII